MQPVGEIRLTFFLNDTGQDPSFSLDFYKYLWACIYDQATHLLSYNSSTYTLEHKQTWLFALIHLVTLSSITINLQVFASAHCAVLLQKTTY